MQPNDTLDKNMCDELWEAQEQAELKQLNGANGKQKPQIKVMTDTIGPY